MGYCKALGSQTLGAQALWSSYKDDRNNAGRCLSAVQELNAAGSLSWNPKPGGRKALGGGTLHARSFAHRFGGPIPVQKQTLSHHWDVQEGPLVAAL